MKIVSLKSENVKKLKAVEINPKDNTVLVTGKNGAGKSSVLDSIWYALGGKRAEKDTPKPIRTGQEKAKVELDLGDYRIVKTWTEKKTELSLWSKDGAKYPSPQTLLDDIVGRISFDPLEFASMDAKSQKAILLDVLGLSEKVEELQVEWQAEYDARRDIGRDLTKAKGHFGTLTKPESIPEKVDTAKLTEDLESAQVENEEIASGNRLIESESSQIDALGKRIIELENEIAKHKEEIQSREKNISNLRKSLKGRKVIDTTPIKDKLQNAASINEQVSRALDYETADREVKELQKQYDDKSAKIDSVVEKKNTLVTSAKLPIEGLNIDGDGVTFEGVPFTQLSSAEQLKVSLAIAMATNPTLRVMMIKDGSLLDGDNLKVIQKMADDKDYQVWIERVESDGKVGIHIVDGQVED